MAILGWFVGGDNLHVSQLQLSPPFPSSLAAIKPENPGSPGKMADKMDRENMAITAGVKIS